MLGAFTPLRCVRPLGAQLSLPPSAPLGALRPAGSAPRGERMFCRNKSKVDYSPFAVIFSPLEPTRSLATLLAPSVKAKPRSARRFAALTALASWLTQRCRLQRDVTAAVSPKGCSENTYRVRASPSLVSASKIFTTPGSPFQKKRTHGPPNGPGVVRRAPPALPRLATTPRSATLHTVPPSCASLTLVPLCHRRRLEPPPAVPAA